MRDAVVRVGGVCCDTMTEFSQYCPEILANDYLNNTAEFWLLE